jgi:hypothetical protein
MLSHECAEIRAVGVNNGGEGTFPRPLGAAQEVNELTVDGEAGGSRLYRSAGWTAIEVNYRVCPAGDFVSIPGAENLLSFVTQIHGLFPSAR